MRLQCLRPISYAFPLALIALTDAAAQRSSNARQPLQRVRSAWTVASQPQLRVAPADTLEFGMVIGLSVLPDGGVVLASHRSNSIQWFDARGHRTRSVGRKGGGPGEFNGVSHFFRFGDTLALIDLRGLTHLFTINGRYVRSEPRLRPAGDWVGYFANGDQLVSVLQTDHITADRWQQTHDILTRRGASSSIPLGTFPSVEAIRHGGDFDGRIYAARNRVAVLHHAFCAGYNSTFEYSCFDEQGTKLSSVQRATAPLTPVSNQDKEAYFAGILEANKTAPGIDGFMKHVRATVQFSEKLPAFGRMLASQDDLIWIGPPSIEDFILSDPNPLPNTPTMWSVFSVQGTSLSDVLLPARFRLLDAGANFVAGVTKDADDNEVIVVYPLQK